MHTAKKNFLGEFFYEPTKIYLVVFYLINNNNNKRFRAGFENQKAAQAYYYKCRNSNKVTLINYEGNLWN